MSASPEFDHEPVSAAPTRKGWRMWLLDVDRGVLSSPLLTMRFGWNETWELGSDGYMQAWCPTAYDHPIAVPPVASCRCGIHYFPTRDDLLAYVDARPGGFDWQQRPYVGGASCVFVATQGALHGHCLPDRNRATRDAPYSVMRVAGYSVSTVVVPQDVPAAALQRRYSVDVRVLDERDGAAANVPEVSLCERAAGLARAMCVLGSLGPLA